MCIFSFTACQPKFNFQPISKNVNTNISESERQIALYIAEHSSIDSVDHLTQLYKTTFADSKTAESLKVHRTKCTGIIVNILAPHFETVLIDDVGNN